MPDPRGCFALSLLTFALAAPLARAQFAGTPALVTPGARPTQVVIADANLDGIADVVAGNDSSSGVTTITLFPGLSGGAFGAPSSVNAGSGANVLAVGDLNGDALPDLIWADSSTGALSRAIASGPGVFLPPNGIATLADPHWIGLADLDANGSLDLVVSRGHVTNPFQPPAPALVTVFLAVGGGYFPGIDYSAGTVPSLGAIRDFNADGKIDIAVLDAINSRVVVLRGTGGGLFTSAGMFGVDATPNSLTAADLNGDGAIDLHTGSSTKSTVTTLYGVPPGFFAPMSIVPAGGQAFRIAAGDFNADGKTDLVTSDANAQLLHVLIQQAIGSFAPPTTLQAGSGDEMSAGDLDGDAIPDLAEVSMGGGCILVRKCDGAGGFVPFPAGLATLDAPTGVAAGDLNGDGRPDVVTSHRGTFDGTAIHFGDGTGGLTAPLSFAVGDGGPISVALGDIDGDGRLDVVTTTFGPASSVAVQRGLLGGTLAAAVYVNVQANAEPKGVAIADLDANGKADVVAAQPWFNNVAVLRGDGAGGLLAPAYYMSGSAPASVAIGDWSGDGKPDLATPDGAGPFIRTLTSLGGGLFGAAQSFASSPNGSAIATGDFNGDGKRDLVGSGTLAPNLSVLIGNGAGLFAPPVSAFAAMNPITILSADVDGDGKTDLVTLGSWSQAISILRGTGSGTFLPATAIALDKNVRGIALTDLDADGAPDLVVCGGEGPSVTPGSLTVLRNQKTLPVGIFAYGAGSPGCAGILGMSASGPPQIGNATFGFETTNAPKNTLGVAIIANAPDFLGSDVFGLGIALHLNLLASTEILSADFKSDSGGVGFAKAPIPNFAPLVGKTYFVQGAWVEPLSEHCGPSVYALISSAALALTIF